MARTAMQIAASGPAAGRAESVDTTERTGEESTRAKLAQEEASLSEAIVKLILDGRWELLNPNSGNSVAVGDHHVCVGYEEDAASGYRTWEWHGHVLVYDGEHGYVPEYIYGNFFELLVKTPLTSSRSHYEGFLNRPSLGLGEIINGIQKRASQRDNF
ncbi:unnamed protein product [Sphagnum balticum]|jgi:hypothetical protein